MLPVQLQRLAALQARAGTGDDDQVLAEAHAMQCRIISVGVERAQRLIALDAARVLIRGRDLAARAGFDRLEANGSIAELIDVVLIEGVEAFEHDVWPKRFMGSGSASRALRSASEAVLTARIGNLSEN